MLDPSWSSHVPIDAIFLWGSPWIPHGDTSLQQGPEATEIGRSQAWSHRKIPDVHGLGPWGPGTGLPKVCLKTLGSRLSFEMRNETKGIQRLLNEIVEFVYVCFQAISRWPSNESNDFRWLTGVLYCSSSPAMENFEVPDVESSQVPPCTNPITSVVCHQMLGTCCMTVPVRNRPVRRFKP